MTMRSLISLLVFLVSSVAQAQPQPAPAVSPFAAQPPLYPDIRPARPCDSLTSLALANTTIESAAIDKSLAQGSTVCRVTAVVTHPPAGDKVKVWIALPIDTWNGRFQGVGGGGMSGGSEMSLRAPAAAGYVAAATDTGHDGGSGSFALGPDNRHNWILIRDNAYLGIHDMTVTAKAVTAAFYGKPPRYSYWNGCSTGGRQGLSEAQRYPADYDGILAGAPAINFPKLHVAQLWGPMVMQAAGYAVPTCRMTAATEAAVKACDGTDGISDGVIGDPTRCSYDPKALIGTGTECGPFTEADAEIIRKIWEGPRRLDGTPLWPGLPRGAAFALSATGGAPLVPRPFGITLDWLRYFVTQNPTFDWTTITPAAYEQIWDQSYEQFNGVIGTDNPDLSAFRDRGGKIVMWHGWADQLIVAGGSIDYMKRVQQHNGGPAKTGQFARLFMAPGVGHCGGGPGAAPSGPFDAVVKWVEQGLAPETLQGVKRDQNGTVTMSRPVCQYPLSARYKGRGSENDAGSFECRADR
jgi:feruloyl esterase